MTDIEQIFFEGQCKREQSQACLNSAECSLSSIFYQLIRVAIGTQETLSRPPSGEEWRLLYDMAKKQSLIGVCFVAVQRLTGVKDTINHKPYTIHLQETLYLNWMGMAAQINMKNELVNRQCVEVQQRIENAGFRTFIMKGQGNAALYQSSSKGREGIDSKESCLSLLRQSGDIDIYLDGGFDKVMKFVNETHPTKEVNELEIHYHCFSDPSTGTEVEIHYRPFIMRNPFKNRKLQGFFNEAMRFDNKIALPNDAGEINVPISEFNLVHQMVHIYHHLITEGVGMRQLMDYYFVLRTVPSFDSTQEPSSKVQGVIHDLGLDRFASALMWVLGYVFTSTGSALVQKEEYMLWEPCKEDGRLFLEEIERSGNFGHHDETKANLSNKWSSFWYVNGKTFRFWRFDHWAWFWSPLWRVYHFAWRKMKGFK